MTLRSREKKMKVTEQNWIEKLKELQATFIDDRQAHRQTVYLTTTKAFRVSVKLRSSPSAVRAFFELAGEKRPSTKNETSQNAKITHAVIAFVTGAKSKKARKLAWKRARALSYLYDMKSVPLAKLPGEIARRGGIEALVKLAARNDSRRSKIEEKDTRKERDSWDDDDDVKTASKKASSRAAMGPASKDSWDMDVKPSKGGPLLDISRQLREKLKRIEVGRRVKLIGIRTDEDQAILQVLRVIAIKE